MKKELQEDELEKPIKICQLYYLVSVMKPETCGKTIARSVKRTRHFEFRKCYYQSATKYKTWTRVGSKYCYGKNYYF